MSEDKIKLDVPVNILSIAKTIHDAGFEIYLVGGCVRGMIMNMPVNDWDYTTNANPDEIQALFDHTVYKNDFGTVSVVLDDDNEIVEITPYRVDGKYIDGRKPDKVVFGKSLDEDLLRRDFTINALAYNPITFELIDNHGGIKDLHLGVLKTVGDPDARFDEDALRLLRAVRIATQLSGEIEDKTFKSILKKSDLLKIISTERIRDELIKILMAKNPSSGILMLNTSGILKHILPELLLGVGVDQNQAHKYDVFEHNIRTLEHSSVKDMSLELRFAALLHDVGKPATREWSKSKKDWTFYAHDVVGARMAKKILTRLKLPSELVKKASLLVRWHMFFSDTEQITSAGVRRMVARVGEKNIWDLIDLRMCDRIGTGRPKEQPYRLRKYASMVEEVLRDPITPGTLCINGNDLIKDLNISPGPKIGHILNILLAEVIEDTSKNTKEILIKRSLELIDVPEKILKSLGNKSKDFLYNENVVQIDKIKKKHGVK